MQAAINEKYKVEEEHNSLMEQRKEQEKQKQSLKDLQEQNKRRKLENDQQRLYNENRKMTKEDKKQYDEALKEKFTSETESRRLKAEGQAYDDFNNNLLQLQAKTNINNVQNEITKNIHNI